MTVSILDKSKWNRLIWGDNLLAMQALLAQGYASKINLIYIDPPYTSEADYSYPITVGGRKIDKEASIIERLAYTDTWEGGLDSYLDMLYTRLQLMKRLLSETGSIYVHIDWRVVHYLKILLDEVFGSDKFVNHVTWKRQTSSGFKGKNAMGKNHDDILIYSKGSEYVYNTEYVPYTKEYIEQRFCHTEERTGRRFKDAFLGTATTQETIERLKFENRIYYTQSGGMRLKVYLDEAPGIPLDDVWTDINFINSMSDERTDFPTQKPEALLERIIKASSNEGDLVADFFCGSGTTMAVAERLNRRWIGCNLDKVGIQVSRNRLVNQGAKSFLLENIGNYQRHMIYLSGSKINEMQRIILKLYGAEPRSDRPDLGILTNDDKDPELAYVGYPDRPITAKKVIELAQDAQVLDGTGYKSLVVLAWDYDYNFSTELESRKKALSDRLKVEIKTLTIPPEIYNYLKKAKNENELDSLRDKIVFHEKPYLRVSKPAVRDAGDGKVAISVSIDRYVLMDFPIADEKQKTELRKAIKDNFAVLIDYWAIDWDYDGKTFRSMWQAIRGNGKQTKTVITTAESLELPAGKRTVAVRLVDVFGNDASATVEVK
jgi:adenine-specific DNA-methyltransferase